MRAGAVLGCALLLLSGCGRMALRTPTATARLLAVGSTGTATGVVNFQQHGERVIVDITMSGLTPGAHGVHIHHRGNCTRADGSSAGPHFNPHGQIHGGADTPQRHGGDLGNLVADAEGVAHLRLEVEDISLEADRLGVIGRSVLVRAGADDLTTQPDGGGGLPVACGLISKSTDKWF